MSKFKYYEERFGPHFSNELMKKDEKNNKKPFILTPLLVIRFLVQLFFTGPDRTWQNPVPVILMGLFLFFFNGYLIMSDSLIENFVEIYITDHSAQKDLTSFLGVICIIQVFRAVYIIGGWNQIPDGKPLTPEQIKRLASLPDTRPIRTLADEDSEFDKTISLMNQKMAQMTNSQKEDYLRDFYGGKKS